MVVVTLDERVNRALEHHARAARGPAGGLLLGHRTEERIWVTRSVPAPNVAADDRRRRSYELDPGAVRNVGSTASRWGLRIVGVYTVGVSAQEADEPVIDRSGGTELWLDVMTEGQIPRARLVGSPAGTEELRVEVPPPAGATFLQCVE